MRLSDFDYPLPPELIAQEPLADRAGSRMLIVDRQTGSWRDALFRDLPSCLHAGDCLVLNESKVIPCRLLGTARGREIELFLHKPATQPAEWLALAKPGKRVRVGELLDFGPRLRAEVLAEGVRGERRVRLLPDGDLSQILEDVGHMPLPPYIRRPDRDTDRVRYQTVFARHPGSAAAPTAGLHFDEPMLAACRTAGAAIATVTLHVGLGTFQPLAEEEVEANRLHAEFFEVPSEATAQINAASRVVAVGTTAVRALESAAAAGTDSGETSIFIYPGYRFRTVHGLLTNFHLPRSSLVLLVAAFAGKQLILDAYRHAVAERYRFFSYGDCMLIL